MGEKLEELITEVRKEISETKGTCEQTTQEIIQIREENKEEIAQVWTDIGERMERVYNNLNQVDGQVKENKEKIHGINKGGANAGRTRRIPR